MSGRPEILFPLFANLQSLDGVGPKSQAHFAGLGVERPRDLLYVLPVSGIERIAVSSVLEATPPAVVTVEIEVGLHQPNARKGAPYRVVVNDSKSSFQLVFFHPNATWLRKSLPTGARRLISGKLEIFDGVAQMVHPDHILQVGDASELPTFEPVYPLSAGLTQKLVFKAAHSAIDRTPELPEWIAPSLKKQEKWPDWAAALRSAHTPTSIRDCAPQSASRRRLAYDELFAHQVTLAIARAKSRRAKGRASQATGKLQAKVLNGLPYAPTAAQTRAIAEICEDLGAPVRMSRLLQGDVGSGKTLVAMLALLAVVEAGGQGVMMAPTEILARQHLESLTPMAQDAGIVIDILTGRDKGKDRAHKLVALKNGDINILLGTHAVFQSDVAFNDLRLAVVDEQHRFGVRQRMQLGAKGQQVDNLVMTATPIPRSLALAQFGDMDISVLDEKPAGRQKVETVLVSNGRLSEVVARLQAAIAEGRQAYWVCPLVGESETVDLTAAEERYRALRVALGEDTVGLVHGQLAADDKDAAMARFVRGETKVLVATTVIEVGVDVPNATIMVVERAENFGLAQLHQLRGRVGRGSDASTCLLLYAPQMTQAARERLTVMRDTDDGFKIAETDLHLRGAGDVLGVQQSGLPKFRIADLETHGDLMELARDDARMLLATDPDLTSDRGQATRTLLYLTDQDQAIRLISVG